jgi:hypothetical protein
MKMEYLLAQHFYNTRQLTLQGIGTFTLSPDFVAPQEKDKDLSMPANAIGFTFNPKATEDPALIDYIVQQTRKIKPLASSDLESYLMLGSQFLNIGKPFKIEGIGVLEKNQLGEYQFIQQGHFTNAKVEDAPVVLKEKIDDNVSFSSEDKAGSTGNGKKVATILAGIAVLGAIIFAAYYFLNKKETADTNSGNASFTPPVIVADTTKKDSSAIMKDTNTVSGIKPDSISAAPATTTPVATGAYNFKVVIKSYPSLLLAQKSYSRLTSYGHKLLLYTTDSVNYKVAMPFSLPLSDTAYARDSIRKRLFGGNPYIELK